MAEKVLLMVRELNLGGCERDVAKLAKSLDQRHFEPHVGCFRPEGFRCEELIASGIPVVAFGVSSFLSPSILFRAWELARYMKKHRIRLVQGFDIPTSFFICIARQVFDIPVALASQLSYRDLYRPIERRLFRHMDRLADRIVVNSRAVYQDLVDQWKLRPGQLFLSQNGIDTEVFRPGRSERPEALRGASLVIGTVCALREEKNLPVLIEAFEKALPSHPGMMLLIVGSGNRLPQLQEQTRRLGLNDKVVFQPAVGDVVPWMRAIDIFVLSSLSESFPNALLEAAACGCCVVGSRVGGVPEIILDGQTGLLFESGNVSELAAQLRLLASDPELRSKLAAAASAYAHAEFSMARAAARMQGLYSELLDLR